MNTKTERHLISNIESFDIYSVRIVKDFRVPISGVLPHHYFVTFLDSLPSDVCILHRGAAHMC